MKRHAKPVSFYKKLLKKADEETKSYSPTKCKITPDDYEKLRKIQTGNYNSWSGRSY